VHYERLGLKFESYDQWIKSGAQIPVIPFKTGRSLGLKMKTWLAAQTRLYRTAPKGGSVALESARGYFSN